MSMLLLQTFLLMLTAFFLGALVACLIKSTFFDVAAERMAEPVPIPAPVLHPRPAAIVPQPPPRPAPDPVRPKIETVVRSASAPAMPIPDAQRFERALREQTAKSAPQPAAVSESAVPRPATVSPPPAAAAAPAETRPAEPAQVSPRVEVKPPAPLQPNAPAVAKPAAVAPAAGSVSTAPMPEVGIAAAVAAAAAIAASQVRAASPVSPPPVAKGPAEVPPAASPVASPEPRSIMPVAAGSSGPASVSAPASAPVKAAAPESEPADDLTRIRAIDAATQGRLNSLGVRRYADLARLTTSDVARMRAEPGIGSRVTIENWIEQAQILAKGDSTEYARRRVSQGQPIKTATPSPDAGASAPVRAPLAPAAAPASPAPSTPAAPIAPVVAAPQPTAPPVPAAPPATSVPAAGFELPRTGAQAAAAAAAAIAAAAAASARRTESVAAQTAAAPVGSGRDDFRRIHGINAEAEKLLQAQGITRYAQIANWSAADTERLNGLLGSPGRISRENWIEQAAVLAGGAAGTYTRRVDTPARPTDADAPRPARLSDALREREAATKVAEPKSPVAVQSRPDLSGLRSVRSEALRGDQAGAGTASDDLKRIRGIGVLIEKKLNSLGIANYEQIANWTGADIDRVSQILDFKGRIERESWVEQARILSSGGKTEFSQRVDKGDA